MALCSRIACRRCGSPMNGLSSRRSELSCNARWADPKTAIVVTVPAPAHANYHWKQQGKNAIITVVGLAERPDHRGRTSGNMGRSQDEWVVRLLVIGHTSGRRHGTLRVNRGRRM